MNPITGITEDDIANYLANTPGFFERHAALLASVELANPHGQRAVSLQQRQMEMLRERIRGLERRIMEMIRHGQDYAALVDRLQHWTRGLMLHADPYTLPEALVGTLREQFQVPQTALRLWGVAEAYTQAPWAAPIDDEVRGFAAGLTQPYCGASPAFQAVQWLPEPEAVASLALVPIRRDGASPVRGLLVLASPDPTRYGADLGTDFLARIGEIAGAALARLLVEEPA